MYCIKLTLTPTAPMTFRILPGSILNIATYPFVPPTTLSGFLRRVAMLSARLELPETRINKDNPPFYTLPHQYITLGAYPTNWSGVHRTYRKGMREFSHDTFSRLYIEKDRANFQLHTWEYFIAEELVGYVASESREGLERFQELESYGCKLGKEGFAIVSTISQPIPLQRERLTAQPSTLVPMEDILNSNTFVHGCNIYNLYRYNWGDRSQDEEPFNNNPTAIDGFIPFVVAHYPQAIDAPPTLEYYQGDRINIPVSLVNLLRGQNNV